jgi:hypothetical protein
VGLTAPDDEMPIPNREWARALAFIVVVLGVLVTVAVALMTLASVSCACTNAG